MSAYEVYFSVSITPKRDDSGYSADHGNLMFTRKFTLAADRFSDLAPKIDAVQDAIGLIADVQEVL